jgi:predicted transcriptional regulator of viral defense system
MPGGTGRERILRLARRRRVIAAAEVTRAGIHGQELSRLVREGALERVARGLYHLPDRPVTEHHALALAARAVPSGVICLLSALGFHNIGTQIPSEVWIALDRSARRPRLAYPPLRVVRFSGPALHEGIESHRIEGQPVRMYGPAKTLADLFKYRNKVGLDVALEALREAWAERRVTVNQIDRYARVCRVERVMRPYLEAILA